MTQIKVHKLRNNYKLTGKVECGLFMYDIPFRLKWKNVTCKNCLETKPKSLFHYILSKIKSKTKITRLIIALFLYSIGFVINDGVLWRELIFALMIIIGSDIQDGGD
ncbi:hypothetical protein GQ473_02555 [archaeon]|nr:hypothetical protein [archaeon]